MKQIHAKNRIRNLEATAQQLGGLAEHNYKAAAHWHAQAISAKLGEQLVFAVALMGSVMISSALCLFTVLHEVNK